MVICLRWADEYLMPHEDFIGLYQIDKTDACTIAATIKDVLIRAQMPLDNCRGQCYDGCSTMSGLKSGVAAIIKTEQPCALYTHCYGHALNLAASDAVKQCNQMKDALDTVFEITKLIKFSPKREAQLRNINADLGNADSDENHAPSIRVLCPTRWTVRARALESIKENYMSLLTLWETVLEDCKDSDIKARTCGVQTQMKKFDFFFGLSLGMLVLGHADTLSEALQNNALTASEAQRIASLTVQTLSSLRNDEMWSMFWKKVERQADENNVSSPTLPRRRRAPLRLEECLGGQAVPEYAATVEDHYRRIYFQALDLTITAINDRFSQPDYTVYAMCEALLLRAINGKDTEPILTKVVEFFKDDFSVVIPCDFTFRH